MPTEPTVLQQLALRFGRRGLKLMVLGVGFIAYGADILTHPHRELFSRPGPSPLDWADSRAWGAMFVLAGAVGAFVGARRRRAPDAIGFAALQIAPSVWATMHVFSWLVYVGTGGDYGEPGRWVGAFIWGILALSIRIDAGWEDPISPDPGVQP